MKINNLILVGMFLLAVLAMGAASASEDLSQDLAVNASDAQVEDSLAADMDDSISEIEDESNEVLSADNAGEDVREYGDDKLYPSIFVIACDSYLTDDKNDDNEILDIHCIDSRVTGTFKFYVDGIHQYSKTIGEDDYVPDEGDNRYCDFDIKPDDLHITSPGVYNIKAEFENAVLREEKIHVYALDMALNCEDEVKYGEEVGFRFYLPSDATGKLTLTVNGRTYDAKYKKGSGTLSLSTVDWDLGNNTAVLRYSGDSKYPADTIEKNIRCIPNVAVVGYMSVGEDQLLTISAPVGVNCDVTLFFTKYSYIDDVDPGNLDILDEIGRFNSAMSIRNGYGSYSLSHLGKGIYSVLLHYKLAGLSDDEVFIYVLTNNQKYSSSISSTSILKGESVTVTLKGPKSGEMDVYVDNELLDDVKISSGKAKKVISRLGVGTHRITVQFYGGDKKFYSHTFKVKVTDPSKVKISLALKKVKVKKSAKKLVLKATLKINKKAAKGKKLTFKFNGKTYKAKTNKKGVSKVTVKKKVIKKLKAGKKVKYQVSFLKITRKLTTKVKK